ncbi:MAG: PilN domain-containing protein [Acidobacteria bacterium]|nr:PilN domain-containing protein [Acidobacteriota bacterium]
MIKINLIGESKRPAAVRKRRPVTPGVSRENLANWLLVAGLLLGLLPTLGEWLLLRSTLASRKAEVKVLQKEYDELKPIIDEVEAFEARNAELERKIGVIQDLKAQQYGPVRVMDQVSRALPELAWLSRMDVDRSTIRLVGQASNENAVANFIENLDRVDGFQEPSLQHMRETRGGYYNFEIRVRYSLPKQGGADGAAEEPNTSG